MRSLLAFWIGGASSTPPPPSAHTIYRLDQSAAGGDVYRGTAGGSSDLFRTPPAVGGKVYR